MEQTAQFTTKVSDGSAVAWSVHGITGGNAAVGTIEEYDDYAPPSVVKELV